MEVREWKGDIPSRRKVLYRNQQIEIYFVMLCCVDSNELDFMKTILSFSIDLAGQTAF